MFKHLIAALTLTAMLAACGPAPQPPAATDAAAAAAPAELTGDSSPVADPEPVAAAEAPAPAPKPRPKPRPASVAPAAAAAAPAPAVPPVCQDCGTITAVRDERVKGDATALGTLGGAAAGGVAGAQFGKKSGKVLATIGGAVIGGIAGREIEKRARGEWIHHVTVSMDAGGTQVVTVADMEGLGTGSKVRVSNGNLIPN